MSTVVRWFILQSWTEEKVDDFDQTDEAESEEEAEEAAHCADKADLGDLLLGQVFANVGISHVDIHFCNVLSCITGNWKSDILS